MLWGAQERVLLTHPRRNVDTPEISLRSRQNSTSLEEWGEGREEEFRVHEVARKCEQDYHSLLEAHPQQSCFYPPHCQDSRLQDISEGTMKNWRHRLPRHREAQAGPDTNLSASFPRGRHAETKRLPWDPEVMSTTSTYSRHSVGTHRSLC